MTLISADIRTNAFVRVCYGVELRPGEVGTPSRVGARDREHMLKSTWT